jgi:hypothetical protein
MSLCDTPKSEKDSLTRRMRAALFPKRGEGMLSEKGAAGRTFQDRLHPALWGYSQQAPSGQNYFLNSERRRAGKMPALPHGAPEGQKRRT